jgi:CBS domain-containing protein
MFVENMLSAAVKRLVSVNDTVPLIDAARPLNDLDIDLVVVCSADGRLAGIITKTDVVRQICSGSGYATAASEVMMRDVVLCRPGDLLRDVWAVMKERSVKNVPIIGQDSRPIGVLNARDVVEVLMDEAEYEEALLRDYVMSVGYH